MMLNKVLKTQVLKMSSLISGGVAGSVFASPPTASILAAIKAVAKNNDGKRNYILYIDATLDFKCWLECYWNNLPQLLKNIYVND